MPQRPAGNTYTKLIQTLRRQLREGLARAELAVIRQRALTYHAMGREIGAYLENRQGPDLPHLEKISREIGYGVDSLRKMVSFARAYPRLSPALSLSWAQYKALLTAPETQRSRLEKLAREGLGADQIYAEISLYRRLLKGTTVNLDGAPMRGGRLDTRRGRLYHYKTVQSGHVKLKKGKVMIDVGFAARSAVSSGRSSGLRGGHTVRSVKTNTGYQLRYARDDDAGLYTYAAKVSRVIDGDTLGVTVDCGFDIWMDVTVRLFGIDAPEKSTASGRAAHQYVAARLPRGKDIVVKTYKTEKYGRYLADVYYGPRGAGPEAIAGEGTYLNQELLDKGMAGIYSIKGHNT